MTAGSPIPGLLERRHPLARSPPRRVVITPRIAGGLNHEQGPSWLVLGLVGWPLRRSTSIIVSAANAEIPYEGVLTPAGDSQPRAQAAGSSSMSRQYLLYAPPTRSAGCSHTWPLPRPIAGGAWRA